MSSVMLVTADRELSKVVKAALHGTTARVAYEVSSPQAAADTMAQHPSALVVVDLFLPGTSGLEVLKMLKRLNTNCLFLLLTRIRTRTVLERAFRFGAQDVLHYPVSTDILRDTILHRLSAEPIGEDEPAEQAAKPARKK